MNWITTIIPQYLSVILSWPVLGTVTIIIFFYKFSVGINKFLSTHEPKDFGPFGTQQKQLEETLDKTEEDSVDAQKELDKKVGELEVSLSKSTEDKKRLEQLIEFQRQISETNEFSYLALFFVETTKKVINWFYENKNQPLTTTKESFNSIWGPSISDANQREIIFNVIFSYNIISGVLGGSFVITEKGERFLKFIGYIS